MLFYSDKIKKKITLKLLFYILVFSTFITLMTTAINLYADYAMDMKLIEKRIRDIQKSSLPSLSQSLWYMDSEYAQTQLNGLLHLPDIQYLKITSEVEQNTISAGSAKPQRIRSYEFPLKHRANDREYDLGNIRIDIDLDNVYQRLFNRVLVILGTQALKTFLVSGFIFIIVQWLVTRHLTRISDFLAQQGLDNLEQELALPGSVEKENELGRVVGAINRMKTDLHQNINALKESEGRFRAIYENAPVLIDAFDGSGRCLLWNNECEKTFGWTIEEINNHGDALSLFYPDPDVRAKVTRTVTTDPEAHFREWHPVTKDGKTLDTMWANFKLPDGLIFNLGYDITEQNKAEQQIQNSLKEKEVMLKEIHHRVKNNLQMVESLLNLQLSETSDQGVRSPLEDSKSRVRSMALVHETLYRSGDFTRIDMKKYIKELINPLIVSMRPANTMIDVTYDIGNISLDIDTAMACGLIINELVVNALKHAFTDKSGGNIRIEMQPDTGDHVCMTITDDGAGMPQEKYHDDQPTLGLQIVKLIAEKQLEAVVQVDGRKGTVFNFSFPFKQVN